MQLVEQILKAFKGIVFITDEKDTIIQCFGLVEEILAYSPEELKGRSITILFFPEDREILFSNLKYKVRTIGFFKGRIAFLGKNGQKRILELYLSSDKGEKWTYILKDCTEEVERERKIKEHIKYLSLGEIANVLAHHLRNPITGIGGFSKRALRICMTDPKCREYLQIIQKQAERLEKLVKVIETFVFLPSPHFQPVVFIKLLKQVLQRWIKRYPDRRWRFYVSPSYGSLSLKIMGDPLLLEMALDELLKNACNFTRPKDIIQILLDKEIKRDREYVNLIIKDTGQGMSKEDLENIFNLFYTKRPEEIGIGLTLTQKIIKMHNGDISFQSELGRGTQVQVEIPVDRRRLIRYMRLKRAE